MLVRMVPFPLFFCSVGGYLHMFYFISLVFMGLCSVPVPVPTSILHVPMSSGLELGVEKLCCALKAA
jgi:hypothetical protein